MCIRDSTCRVQKTARNLGVSGGDPMGRVECGRGLLGGGDQHLIGGIILREHRGLRSLKTRVEQFYGEDRRNGRAVLSRGAPAPHPRLRQAATEGYAKKRCRHTPPDRTGISENFNHHDPPDGQTGALAKFAAALSQLTVFHHAAR